MQNREDFVLDTPMKKMLVVTNLKQLANETDVPYSSLYRYLSGLNKDIKHTNYDKIKRKMQELVSAL